MSEGRAPRADDNQPDLKWVVEWLVEPQGQRKTAALLGVNRKTVAVALRRERLTGRMTLAVQRLMANLDDPGWESTTPETGRRRPTPGVGACVCSTGGGSVSHIARKTAMDERVRWVPKAEAARELEISLSTLDRKIRRGEIEVAREGRRAYVRMDGPEYVGDDELLRGAITRGDELERTVRGLEQTASELERERDEAREVASASKDAYEELTEAYRNERAAHGRTRRVALRLGLVAVVLFALVAVGIPMAWRLFT